MKNKKIPWWVPQIGEEGRRLAEEVLDGGYLNDGEFTARFEKKIADLLGCKHAVAVTSGTAAIFLSLKGLGVGPGDEVIVPDATFIATANAVDLCGAKPVLVDINPDNLTIDAPAIIRAITSKTKAIVPVHVTGRGADMEAILKIAKEHNLFVVEDAAEALMSKHKGKYLGTWGQAGCFSFSPFKIIGTGQGGMIVTDDDKLEISLRELKDQGRPKKGTGGDDIHRVIGYNFKLTNLQAAVGLGQLSQLEFRIKKIKETYRQYLENLNPNTVSLFKFNITEGELPLWIDGWTDRRNELCEYLSSKNIDYRKFWFPIHTQNPYKLSDDSFLNSSKMLPQSFWLPSAFTLSKEDVLAVCGHINDFFRK